MSFESGERVNVKVMSAQLMRSAAKGTLSAHVVLENEQGDQIAHDIWLTENTKERAEDDLRLIGFDVKKHDFSDIGRLTRGSECSIFCEIEKSKNPKYEDRLKVRWLNPKIIATDETPEEQASRLFKLAAPARGKIKPKAPVQEKPAVDDFEDGDVPF